MDESGPPSDERTPDDRIVQQSIDVEDLSPETTFSVLGNETRLSILRALWDSPAETVSFAALGDHPYIETDNLNYHLGELVGRFVRRRDGGYALGYAGERVMRAMLTGVFSEPPTLSPREIDTRCPYCGGAVELRYTEERLNARCTACGGTVREGFPRGTFMNYGFPPSGLADRSPDEILEAAHVLYDAKVTPMMKGICPECASTVSHTFDICDDHDPGEDGLCASCGTRFEVWTEYRCDHCEYARACALWFKVLIQPAVIAFYHEESGLDEPLPFSKLTWRNAPYIRDISTSVVSAEPLRFRVDIPLGGARLTARVDEALDVYAIERTDGPETTERE